MTIKLFIDIEPMGAVRTTRSQQYKDDSAKRYKDWKQELKDSLLWEHGFADMIASTRPISIKKLVFHMPINDTGKAVQLINGEKKRVDVQPGDYHVVTPDIDNLTKACFDGMNKIVWYDDCQVVHIGEQWKIYSERPGIEIEIVELS